MQEELEQGGQNGGAKRMSRRRFLSAAGAAAAGAYGYLALPARAGTGRDQARSPVAARLATQVAVLGGGVGGLTAAHELVERGFKVTVFEPKALGGKARSIPVPGTGTGGRQDLPGEHGFRFFPGFYKNIPDTMRRIPVKGNPHGVFDNLVSAHQELVIFDGDHQLYLPPSPDSNGPMETARTVATTIGIAGRVPANEIEYFVRKMEVFFTSCDARRVGEWEYVRWWDYVNAGKFSPEYQRVFGNGLTKDLVAAKGQKASTRTIGLMAEAFVYAGMAQSSPRVRQESGYGDADRLLNAPTNEAWIDPWVSHLDSLGVAFVTGYAATKLHVQGARIVGVDLARADGQALRVDADWIVAAMPVEKARVLFDRPVREAAPELARLDDLEYDYMNGIQFFLNRPPAVSVRGHVAYIESPWALTSIDQGLFWNRDLKRQYGDGRVTDILSIDISDFFTPGVLYGKRAVDCTPEQIANETWTQLKQGLNASGQNDISDDMIVSWFLDPAITYAKIRPAISTEPLLINTAGSLDDRPYAHTAIPNLFLAADYVRTNVDLATMEGANEAGRQAANALLAAAGSHAPPASLGALWQPTELAGVRNIDQQRYKAGLPNVLDTIPAGLPL
jgi:uncharacterized protein with NAD-binding domain and iron-sulfur cluster